MPHLSTAQRLFCVPRKHFGDLQLLSLCPPRFHVVLGRTREREGWGNGHYCFVMLIFFRLAVVVVLLLFLNVSVMVYLPTGIIPAYEVL